MALIKSTILAQISGSINGMTFSHNRGGSYARNRSIPSNPGTDRQDQVRTAMASLAKAWGETLSDGERTLWRNYGANTTVVNRLGDSITLSGIAAFQRINLFRMSTLGEAMVETPPPAPLGDAPPTFLSVASGTNIPSSPAEVVINLNDAPTGYGLAVYYSGPLSPGVRYYRGPYIGHTTEVIANTGQTVTLDDLIVGPTAGESIAMKVTCYRAADSLPVWTVNTEPIILQI